MTILMVISPSEYRALKINRHNGDYITPDMVSNSKHLTDHVADGESAHHSHRSYFVYMDHPGLQLTTTVTDERTRLYKLLLLYKLRHGKRNLKSELKILS